MNPHANLDQHHPSPERLARLVREHGARRQPERVNLEPASAYEAITRQMVDDLVRELSAVRTRLDSLFYIVVGSVVVDVFVRIVG